MVSPADFANEVGAEALAVQQRGMGGAQMVLQGFVGLVGAETDAADCGRDGFVAPDVVLPQVFLGRPSFVADLAKRRGVAVLVDGSFRGVLQG